MIRRIRRNVVRFKYGKVGVMVSLGVIILEILNLLYWEESNYHHIDSWWHNINTNADMVDHEKSSNSYKFSSTHSEEVRNATTTQLVTTTSEDKSIDRDVLKSDQHQKNQPRQPLEFLTCNEIVDLEIVRILAHGKQKAAYEIILPSGDHAVAKRCRSEKCVREGRVKKEASILKSLQQQYGNHEAIGFFGECDAQYKDLDGDGVISLKEVKAQATNFSLGTTLVMEMGRPLLAGWGVIGTKVERECFATYLTEADLHGFRTIARQYANSTRCISKMEGVGADNIYVEQYIISQAGLRHGDFDNVECCEDCSYADALEFNCEIVSQVAHKSLICEGSDLDQPVRFPDDHINTTEAVMKCVK